MPKLTDPSNASAAAKAAARNTDSGPSKTPKNSPDDPAAQKMVQTQNLAAAMPFNPNKPLEHGFHNGLLPPIGATAQPESRLPTGSTLSEENRG